MSIPGQTVVSRGAALQAARKFRELFKGCFARWETCGWMRRELRVGPMEMIHLAIPQAADATSQFDNALWERAAQLLSVRKLEAVQLHSGMMSGPDAEAVLIELMYGGWHHHLVRTHPAAWGVQLAQHTGPRNYFQMLLWRLKYAGTLSLHHGMPCVIDRSGTNEQPIAIHCPDERMFFLLARTTFKSPPLRFPFPTEARTAEWTRGMLPEWYPPGVKVYVNPTQPGLFDNGKTVRVNDEERWMHS